MRIEDPSFPKSTSDLASWALQYVQSQTAYLRRVVGQLNNLADGRLDAVNLRATAAPTTGTWAAGDIVRNSAPAEAGGAGSKYVVIGWICTVGGTPGTWLAMRTLTGN